MRTLYLLVLTCAFPFIALSQIQPDKAIIDDYAHPAFVQMLRTSGNKIIIQTGHSIYLAAAFDPAEFTRENDAFTVLRKLSPVHAVILLKQPSLIQKTAGLKFLLPAGNSWKLSPALMTAFKEKAGPLELIISVRNTEHFKTSLAQFVIIKQEYPNNLLRVAVNDMAGQSVLISYDSLLFADLAHRKPKEELLVSGFDLGANRVNAVHHHYPAIHGGGLMVSVKENRFDSADIDLRGRVINSNLASPTLSGHATIMATMLAGAGNSFYEGKGVAWKANLQSTSFANLLPEPDNYYSSQKISVQNHSYGTGIENYYGADASAYDASVINNPVLTHVFSSGNSGLAPGNGPYAGVTGFANLTGSFKMAKNVLVSGATDSVGNVEGPSSRGPAYDGRIKPELVAFGQDGSSGAAAIVSGIALLMQDAYRKIHNDSLPPAALLKAILINSADDIGTAGPDYSSGYGSVNAYKATKAINNSNHFSNNIQQGNSQRFNLQVPPGLRLLKITLTWTDPPAQANAFSALVNDLDLELVHLQSGNSWLPWTLSRFALRDSLLLPAIRGRDSINNAEQITLENPPAGDYEINVKGKRISSSSQSYFISYGADTMNRFNWMYPMPADPVMSGTNQMLRWTSGYAAGTTGKLELSLTRGTSWETIESNADLSRNYIRFTTPDTFSTALV
ncbi:MAG TPA: S8 family serine peptidase, partial [Chitinophagaceae bacterium]